MSIVPEALRRLFTGGTFVPGSSLFALGDSPAGSRPPSAGAAGTIEKGSRTGALVAFEQLGQPVWSPRDYGSFAREGFMQNAILYRSVRMIAEAAASIPLILYEGDTEIEAHPLLDLMRQPSYDHTGTDFLESWFGFLLVAGNAYVEAVQVGGVIRELHILRPDRMKVIPGPDGWPEGYEYTAGGQSIRFMDEVLPGVRPILHTRLFHPVNDHYGMSPIEAAGVAIDIHNEAAKWNKALLDNSARPSGALVYAASNGQMTAEQFERLKSELEASYQSTKNAGRPMLLEGGLDWKPLSLSPKDMDFIEAKNSAAREIALALGVPPMLLGIPGDNTYSNYAEAQRAFWRQTVLPLVNRMTRAMSGWLSPAYGGALELRADLDQVEALNPEREALWARLNAATFLTDDEKRAAAGYALLPPSANPSHKYSPDQPRVPAGNPDGGQWTGGGGASPVGGRGDDKVAMSVFREWMKRNAGRIAKLPKPALRKPPDFLTRRPGVGKITGDVSRLTKEERRFAEELRELGQEVDIIPTGPGRSPDFAINGVRHELKNPSRIRNLTSEGISKSVSKTILRGRGQSGRIIVDAREQSGMTQEIAERSIARAFGADAKRGLKSVTILTKDGPVHVVRSWWKW